MNHMMNQIPTIKKHKMGNMIIKCLIIIMVAFSISTNVFAETSAGTPADEAERNERKEIFTNSCKDDFNTAEEQAECVEAAEMCFNELTPAKFNLSVESSKDNSKFIIKIKNSTSKQAKFSYTYTMYSNGNKIKTSPAEVTVAANKTEEIKIDSNWDETKTVQISVEAKLISEIDAKVKTKSGNDISCNKKYIATASTELTKTVVGQFDNEDYYEYPSGLCYKYMNNQLTKADTGEKYAKLLDDYKYDTVLNGLTYEQKKDEFQRALPYCFNKTISNKDTNLIKKIYSFAKMYATSKKSSSSSELPDPPAGSVEIKDVSNLNLTCDAFGSFDESTGSYISEKNERKFHHDLPEIKKQATYHYNFKTAEKPVDVCKVICREDLTITYGPPVAVKAGFCFEYEVKVESKVNCKSEIIANSAPVYSNYKVCNPVPKCNNGHDAYINQAGPNEEFDECVKETDGGKYTQSAINKCYKKVYGSNKNTTKTSSELALNYATVKKVAQEKEICKQNRSYSVDEARKLYDYYTKNGYYGGYYKKVDNKIVWVKYDGGKYYSDKAKTELIPTLGDCYWNGYARFYFNDIDRAIRTVGNDRYNYNQWNWQAYDNLYLWKYSAGKGRTNVPAGVKDAYNTSVGDMCSDKCSYVSTCDDTGAYYNQVAPYDEVGETKKYMSAEAAYNYDYENEYLAAISQCNAVAECDETTSVYKMTINNLDNTSKICEVGEDGKNCTSWTDTKNGSKKSCKYNSSNPTKNGVTTPATSKNSTPGSFTKETIEDKCNNLGPITKLTDYKVTPVREISGVCAQLPGDKKDYRTIIGFPGSWLYAKNYVYTYENPHDTINYQFIPGKYCVGTTISSVNENWWTWDQVKLRSGDLSSVEYTSEKDISGTTINKIKGLYNIKALVSKFGKSNWNFDISCFYSAISTETETETNPPETSNPLDYTVRASALDDLFPTTENSNGKVKNENSKETKASKLNNPSTKNDSSKEAKISKLKDTNINSEQKERNILKVDNNTGTGREVGYNWSCDSTNILIKNYPITPTALIEKIQDLGDSIYKDQSDKNEELDYHFVLTREQISEIRDSNNSKGRKKDPYTPVGSTYYDNDDNNIKFYKSSLIHDEKYVTIKKQPSDHTCNNIKNKKCDYLYEYVSKSTCDKAKN